MKFDIDKNSLIINPYHSEGHIYVREQKGYWQKIRRGLSWFLMILFIAIPWLNYQGQQAFLLDIGAQHFRVFGMTFLPQDLMILAWLFMAAAFALFFVTNWLGRVWCGFICPQTIWMLMFTWVEHRVEGTRNQRIKLDKADWSAEKLAKKSIKHGAWLVIAFLTATTFMTYFIPARNLYVELFAGTWSGLTWFWVGLFTLCTYGNAGWLREKMCTVACPYARFQSVMFDKDTKLVTYDAARGENRGPRKRKANSGELGLGDCVDCNLCVEVCPAGIDIRNGLQYECINCGLCIDACNDTMSKFAYAPGLIRFSSENSMIGKISRAANLKRVGYASLTLLTLGVMVVWLNLRMPIEVSVIRDRNALFRVDYTGLVENPYTLSIINKTQQPLHYQLSVQGVTIKEFKAPEQILIEAGEMSLVPVTIIAEPWELAHKVTEIEFVINAIEDPTISIVKSSYFYRN
ncbi:cytochrome c oxidase accessory protein CcoG [Pseudoalteromonas fenneropenaei]|uniref:Cytochrome c oxidase accessory protein CcoG n=1 Tax=Pseudoalteromonas fenneropenaei TaxID=1737459 RepID=A0ABV7CF41_9GAMM